MRNSHFMLLGVLGLLLARQGVEGLKCYVCHDCHAVSPYLESVTCSDSCRAVITLQDNGMTTVERGCNAFTQDTGCFQSNFDDNIRYCFCNEDYCDALATDSDICDSAVTTVASLAVVFIPLLSAILLG